MAIRFPEPPAGITEGVAAEGALPAQQVFTVGLEDLRAAGMAEESVSAEPSWRYSTFDPAGRSQVQEIRGGTAQAPVATGDDRFGPMIREALAVAGEDPRVDERDYEARLFRVPALTLLALWLHSPTSVDLFVPVGPPPPGLERNRIYEDPDFTSAVSGEAKGTLDTYREADNPDELGS
jgi:hypothetical protein